jgi:hypothetical protein
MLNNRLFLTCCMLFLLAGAVFSYDRFVNYTSTLSVNDFASDNDVLWVASSGGLYRYSRVGGAGTLYSDPAQLPDPSITSLCLDANRTLWIGSAEGYLYKRPLKGRHRVITSYFSAGWRITDIIPYGRYLIIGSEKGCSVFDTAKLAASRNATGFGSMFVNPRVNAVAVYRDTLLVGCEEGVAKLYAGGGALENASFYDPSIWTADTVHRFPVKAFVVRQDGYSVLRTSGAMFQGRLVTANDTVNDRDSCELFADSTRIAAFPSRVTSIFDGGGGACCIGTKYNYFYLWDGNDTVNVAIDGPAFTTAQRVYVDREGLTWVLCHQMIPGISVFRNGRWTLYTPEKYPSMEWPFLLGGDFRGIAEDRAGRMWFGTTGVNVKKYDREKDAWTQICIGCADYGVVGAFYGVVPELISCSSWAKSEAIALDSNGFLWIATFNNDAGSLICHDPSFDPPIPPVDTSLPPAVKHYRYFCPPGDPVHSRNIGCLCVDVANNLVVGEGFEGNGKIHVLRYQGKNPLEQGLSSVTEIPLSYGIVYDAAATKDTLTYITTSTGFYTLNTKLNTCQSGLWIPDIWSPVPRDTLIDSTIRAVRTVEMEDDHIMWIGTTDSGLIRYDLSNHSRTLVNETNGLLCNRIYDLSCDRKNGYLWIASERGVSRYSLGYIVGRKNTGTALVYPNPFSRRRHAEVIFEKLPPSSRVLVYSVSGALLASLSPEESGTYGSVCVWRPPASVVPGVYLYTVRSGNENFRGKLIVTP